MALHRCMRVLPHQNDTGGFFVALLHKREARVDASSTTSHVDHATVPVEGAPHPQPPPPVPADSLPSELCAVGDAELGKPLETAPLMASYGSTADQLAHEESELRALVDALDDDGDDDGIAAGAKPPPPNPGGETRLAFTAVAADGELARSLTSFYRLSDRFPWHALLSTYGHLTSRRLYLTNDAGAAVLRTRNLRVLAAGVKAFEKDESMGVGCAYRLVQEAALLLLPYLGARVVRASPRAIASLIRAKSIDLPWPPGSSQDELEQTGSERLQDGSTSHASPQGPQALAGDVATSATPLSATADVEELRSRLAALDENGSCVVTCDNGNGTARCAVVVMKYSTRAVPFISHGEAVHLLDDLHAYYNDPPLIEQLQPLSTAELMRRAHALTRQTPANDGGESAGIGLEKAIEERAETASSREAALAASVAGYKESPRRERRLRGTPLPRELCDALLQALQGLHWPATTARPGVAAEGYIVLSTRRATTSLGARHPHYEIRRLCDELMEWHRASSGAAARFSHSAIAVTRNFVGSPHTDRFDVGPQLAVSLGEFEGGELCVEEAGTHDTIRVVDTRNRIAEVDGRQVHWVRSFQGSERFSLIFYNTEGEVGGRVGGV